MQISISHNFPEIVKKLDRLGADLAEKALVPAVNRVVDQATTLMGRSIREEYNLPANEVRSRLQVVKATRKGGRYLVQATLMATTAKGRSLNVIRFVEKSVSMAQARKRAKAGTLDQLHVKIRKGSGPKAVANAFIGNRGRTVFERVGKGRLPIKPVHTIGVPQMFNARRINQRVIQFIEAKLPERFDHEARRILARWGR